MALPYVLEIPAFSSNDAAFKGEILSLSFATGGPAIGNPNTGTGGTKITVMTLTRSSDKFSALFLSHSIHATSFPKITITGYKQSGNSAGRVAYYVFTLHNAILSNYQLGDAHNGAAPVESLMFNCGEITGKAL
jgi:type VI protein secretion system component Hcp